MFQGITASSRRATQVARYLKFSDDDEIRGELSDNQSDEESGDDSDDKSDGESDEEGDLYPEKLLCLLRGGAPTEEISPSPASPPLLPPLSPLPFQLLLLIILKPFKFCRCLLNHRTSIRYRFATPNPHRFHRYHSGIERVP